MPILILEGNSSALFRKVKNNSLANKLLIYKPNLSANYNQDTKFMSSTRIALFKKYSKSYHCLNKKSIVSFS